MFRSFAAKPITPIAASALVTSLAALLSSVVLAVLLTSVAPEAKAVSQVTSVRHVSHAKGDRLPTPARGNNCSSLGWPYYEQSCLFDLRRPADEPRKIRIIAFANQG